MLWVRNVVLLMDIDIRKLLVDISASMDAEAIVSFFCPQLLIVMLFARYQSSCR